MFTADQLILGKNLREHIGGRWAISLIAYVINAPLNLVSILSNANADQSQSSSPLWLVVAIVGYLALGAVVWLASATLFRNRRVSPVPIWWVVVLGFVAGGVRGVTVGVMAIQFDLTADSALLLWTRIGTGALMGAILIPLAALVLSVISNYKHERSQLIDERVELERAVIQNSGVSETLRGALIESVRTDLENMETSEQARELSHRIWERESPHNTPHVSSWKVIRAAILMNPYATLPVVLLWSMSAVGTLTVAIGFVSAISQIAFSIGVIALMFWIGTTLNRVRWIPGFVVFVVVMSVTVALTTVVASIFFDPRPWPSGIGLMVANAIWLPLLTLLVGIAITAIKSSEDVIAALERDVTETELVKVATERETDELRKEIAAKLHGSVQSRLLITAALLNNGDFSRVAPLVDSAMTATVLESLESEQDVNARESIEAMAKSWSGLMTVEIDLCPDSKLDSHAIAVTRIVEEGLSNAFRHGKATHVSVHLTKSQGSLEVVIADNGVGVSEEIEKGLGLTLIESFNPVEYSFVSNSPQGTILSLKLLIES